MGTGFAALDVSAGASFGRYALLELVGRGGMGEVWKAHDSATDRIVAVKVLNKQFVDDETYQLRFHREARAAAGLNDPHVVPIHGYGEVDGRLYVEMRLIEGYGLDVILRQGQLHPDRAVHVIEQVASALDEAHRAGLVHRDVKPSNILVTGDDFAYLIDFGIARATGDVGLTQTGAALGTWAYMAPERIRSNAVDARSDVYALACVLHECLTGARPFTGNTFEELAAAHLWVPPPAPSKVQHTVPAGFDAVIAGGMAKDVQQRYGGVREFASAARNALDPNRRVEPPVGSLTSAAPASSLLDVEVLAYTITGDLADPALATGDSPRSFAWPPADDPDRAPYCGWQPFEPSDAGIFFGRDAQIVRAVDAVRHMRQAKTKSWFVVLGPSGSGKSAFMRAGLVPRLQRNDGEFVVLPIVRPERDALDGETGFAAAIHAARQAFSLTEPTLDEIKTACGCDPRRIRELLLEIQQAAAAGCDGGSAPTLLVPLDQAEELLAADVGPQAQTFLELIAGLTEDASAERLNLIVAATIRSDRFESLQTRSELADVDMELFAELKPMPSVRFREVILGPATAPADVKRQLAVSADLVEQLLEDCHEGADTLPLLSLTLARLYEDFGAASKVLTLAQYQLMGGLRRVVQSEIDTVLSRDPAQRTHQLAALRAAFIPWLATISPDTDQPLRRVARYDDLPLASRPLVDALVARRLLIKDLRDGDVIVEVALESLLRQWDELAGWLRAERANLKAADHLERASATWVSADRDPAWLLTGTRLVEAETLMGTPGFYERLQDARAFVSNSRGAENYRLNAQEQQRQNELRTAYERQATAEAHAATLQTHAATLKRRSRVLRTILGVTAVVAVVAVVLGVISVGQRQTALRQRNAALATQLNVEAQAILAGDRPGGDAVAFQKILAARTLSAPDEGSLVHAIAQRTNTLKLIDSHAIVTAALSPDGRVLAVAGRDDAIRLLDANTGQEFGAALTGHTDTVYGIAFSPDGHRLATAGADTTVRIWNADNRQQIGQPLTGRHTQDVQSVAFSPDGHRLATASADDTVRLWDADAGEQIGQPLVGHTDDVVAVAFSADGLRLASASVDKTVRLWNASTGQPVGPPLTGHTEEVLSVAFSPDGRRLASGSMDATIKLWNADTGAPIGEPLTGHTDSVFGVTFAPDGLRLASAGADRTVRLWDTATGQPVGTPLTGHTSDVLNVAFTPDGLRLVSASLDDTVRIWAAGNPLSGHTNTVDAVAFSPDGHRLATASDDKTVRLWDADTGQAIGTPLTGHTDGVYAVAYSPDGLRLASAGRDATVRLWNADTGQSVGAPLTGHTDTVFGVAFSPDGHRLATASYDHTVRLWNADTGQPDGPPLTGHSAAVFAVAFSPDGHRLASASDDGTVRLWDVDTGAAVGEPLQHDNGRRDVAFSPDGRRLASSGFDDTVRLWDTETGKPIGEPLAHADQVLAVVFSPDGQRLATAPYDGTVRLWNADTFEPIGDPLTGHTKGVNGLAISPDGNRLASASDDGTVRLWDVEASPKKLCDKLVANMSHSAWDEEISPDISYVKLCPDLPVPPN